MDGLKCHLKAASSTASHEARPSFSEKSDAHWLSLCVLRGPVRERPMLQLKGALQTDWIWER